MTTFQLFHRLPEDLVATTLDLLGKSDLANLSLASRWCRSVATPLVWREVHLVDCSTQHGDDVDEHDDTPLLKKLLVLVQNPWIASCVQTLVHRCHLPPPAIFHELPTTPLSGQTLSPDPRTTKLVQLAVQNLRRVHTLRIIFGHPNINDALLRSFFDKDKDRNNPIRRLWLESCRISAGCCLRIVDHPLNLPLELDFTGLESVRFRRLPLRAGTPTTIGQPDGFVHARGSGVSIELQDGAGGRYPTTTHSSFDEIPSPTLTGEVSAAEDRDVYENSLETMLKAVHEYDDKIYDGLAQLVELPLQVKRCHTSSHNDRTKAAYRGPWLDPADLNLYPKDSPIVKAQRERLPSANVAIEVMMNCRATLTSICLDWVLTTPRLSTSNTPTQDMAHASWIRMFADFFHLKFPHLRALQFRNAVVRETMQPKCLYLLDHAQIQINPEIDESLSPDLDLACLKFMEGHSNLKCLAWPMEGFFSEKPLRSDIIERVEAVIDNLGRTLVDLRVDTLYQGSGESQTDEYKCANPTIRDRRRRFIDKFASKMTKIESIKIEGGIPRDERREVIRALHACPLEKIVMIGVSCPTGNTWGENGRDVPEIFGQGEAHDMEGEDKDSVYNLGSKPPVPLPPNFKFEPTYGWPPGPPMIHTIASLHADTVTELKFCGYKGSPILFTPTPITTPILSALKYFENIETVILSVWLSTLFEEAPRDGDIIKYWRDARSPQSMSLVRTVIDEEPEGWEKELRTKFAPDALAWQITSFMGPFLNEKAKARKSGVHVRASVCIGEWGGIFDIDLHIGKGSMNSDVCLGYKGPREELEPDRRESKLENRRWF